MVRYSISKNFAQAAKATKQAKADWQDKANLLLSYAIPSNADVKYIGSCTGVIKAKVLADKNNGYIKKMSTGYGIYVALSKEESPIIL